MMKMWISGAWVDSASEQTVEVVDLATEEVLDSVPADTPVDVEKAVEDATRVLPAWRETAPVERELEHIWIRAQDWDDDHWR